ncbi:Transcriptional regulator, LytTR family [Sphingorhabdus sp. 109]|nr:Transcriptional regulator, LytTR family [Sphingorhabdus sp. 109]
MAKRERVAKETLVTMTWQKQLAIELLVISGIGLIMGLLGPFGTYAMPFALRLAYWVIFILVGYLIFRPISFAAIWLHEATTVPYWGAMTMALLVAGLPLSMMIGFMINGFRWQGLMFSDDFALLYLQVIGIGLGISLVMRNLFPREYRSTGDQGDGEGPDHTLPLPALYNRLPQGFPDTILALGVEDHYVRVHATERSEMLLMRLGDAIREMEHIEGHQVHRSWWVAAEAVASAKRQDRNWRLLLTNSLEIPVARNRVAALKQIGWIK